MNLYFGTLSELSKSYKDDRDSSHAPLLLFLCFQCAALMVHCHNSWTNPDAPNSHFIPVSLFCPRPYIALSCLVLMDFSWLACLQTSLVFVALEVFRSTGQVFCRSPLIGMCLMFLGRRWQSQNLYKLGFSLGVLGWLGWLSIQVLTSGSWVPAPCWAPCWVYLIKNRFSLWAVKFCGFDHRTSSWTHR